jgi:hypothetical protein
MALAAESDVPRLMLPSFNVRMTSLPGQILKNIGLAVGGPTLLKESDGYSFGGRGVAENLIETA